MSGTHKIGVNARTFSTTEPGGSVQAAIQLTKQLIKDDRFEVALFGHSSIAETFPSADVIDDFYFDESTSFGVVWERTVLPKLAQKHDVDLLFAPNGNGPLTEQDFPVITWIHDVGSEKGWMSPVHRLYRNTTVPRTARLSDRIVTPSSFSKREIDEEIGVPGDKIDVIYNGIDTFYRSDESGSEHDLPDDYILFVSSALEFGKRKNLETVLQSYNILKAEYNIEHQLVLVGSENEEIYRRTPHDDDIQITGYLTEAELKYTYENAEVFLFPSLHEGFGLPPLEAMVCETPTVASDRGPMPEILGEGALFADPTDPREYAETIFDVLDDRSQRQELITCGREQSKRYTWERTKDRLVDSFAKVLSEEI